MTSNVIKCFRNEVDALDLLDDFVSVFEEQTQVRRQDDVGEVAPAATAAAGGSSSNPRRHGRFGLIGVFFCVIDKEV